MRIYQEKNPFQSQVGGGGFNPVREADVASTLERELRQGEQRNRPFYESLRQNNEQRVRNAELKAKQENDKIEQNLKVLGQFSKTINAVADGLALQAKEREAVDQTMGFLTQGNQYLNPQNQQRLQQAQAVEEETDRTGPEVAQIASDLDEQGNEVVAQSVRTNANAGAIIVGGDKIRSLAAISQYPSFINTFLQSNELLTIDGRQIPVSVAARSGDARLTDAAITAGMARFISSRGLTGMNLASVNRMANSLIQTNASVGGALIREGIKDQQTEARDVVQSSAFNLASQGQVTPQQAWEVISQQMFIQGTGYSRQEANKESVKALIAGYVSEGNVDAIEDLKGVLQVPGQKGTELRNVYGPELDAGIISARQRRTQIKTATKTELEAGLYQGLEGAKTNEEKLQLIEETATAMSRAGLHEDAKRLRGNASALMVSGTAQIGDIRVLDQIKNGEVTTIQQLNELKGLGQLTDKGYQDAVKALGISSDNGKPPEQIKGIVEAETKGTRDDFYIAMGMKRDPLTGKLDPGENPLLSPSQARRVAEAIKREQNAVANRAWRTSEGKPQAERERLVMDALREWKQQNFYTRGGKYFLGDIFSETSGRRRVTADDPQAQAAGDSAGFRFRQIADNPRYLTTSRPNRSFGYQDFTDRVSPGGDVPQEIQRQFNPLRNDRVYNQNETKTYIREWNEGRISPELVRTAEQLGITPLSLINSQSLSYGLGAVLPQQPPTPTSSESLTTSKNNYGDAVSGGRRLIQMGFPVRGAAFLAGNIQQESAWQGQRVWGEVAGDMSDRNGGLISWMDGVAHNNFRLKRIEDYLGIGIASASDDQQLQAMKWEMEKYYPEAYRIFMNPHATDRQLIRASRQYWGYGHEGGRYTYARNTLAQLR